MIDNEKFDAIIVYPATSEIINQIANGPANDKIISNLISSGKPNTQIIYVLDSLNREFVDDVLDENIKKLNGHSNVIVVDTKINNEQSEIKENVSKIVRVLSESNLRGVSILVTAGPTPVKIDNVRRITNKFSGKLGIEIANELYLRGAKVMLFQSYSGIRPPEYIDCTLFQDYEEYKELCISHCREYQYGIFSAAVADYKPKEVVAGKIPSGGSLKCIELIQTEKVINLVREMNPNLKMISFKYEEGKDLNQLIDIANKRLQNGHTRVVANDLTLNDDQQKCFLCGLDKNGKTIILDERKGKINIARMIGNDIEKMIN